VNLGLDRIRSWLPPLLALSANSPYWHGADSGYASYRRQVWGRWPSAGPTELFGSAAAYRATVSDMLRTRAILAEGMIYFDSRLSHHYPTLEIRIPDVCLLADDAVLMAALAGALVEIAAREWRSGSSPPPVRTEQLRLATWLAARSGLHEDLVHPLTDRPGRTSRARAARACRAGAVRGGRPRHRRRSSAGGLQGATQPARRKAGGPAEFNVADTRSGVGHASSLTQQLDQSAHCAKSI
jgi:gamma-glutamyl:cysteine ligase YbdK (ATP-grasp superfamily)